MMMNDNLQINEDRLKPINKKQLIQN